VIFLVAYIGRYLILKAMHLQKIFIREVADETVSNYMKKEIIST